MPCQFQIYPDFNLVWINCEGLLDIREILDTVDALDAEPGFHPRLDDVIDLRRLTEIHIDDQSAKKLSELLHGLVKRDKRRKRIAIIAPGEPGLTSANTFKTIMATCPGYTIEIFDDPGSAIAFLGHHGSELTGELLRQEDRSQADLALAQTDVTAPSGRPRRGGGNPAGGR